MVVPDFVSLVVVAAVVVDYEVVRTGVRVVVVAEEAVAHEDVEDDFACCLGCSSSSQAVVVAYEVRSPDVVDIPCYGADIRDHG